MSSTNGSEPVAPKEPRKRAPRSTPAKDKPSQDPEVLAAEIEKTREDLAETFDAIADKVSPKRVAERTRKKVADKVSDVTEQVREAATGAKDKAAGLVDDAVEASAGVPPLPPVTATQADGLDLTTPVTTPVTTPTGVPTVDATTTAPVFPAPAPSAAGSGLPKEALAGGALGVLVLLLLRRRRARRRAVRTGAAAAIVGAATDVREEFQKGRRKARRSR